MNKILKYIFSFGMIYIAMVGGEVIGADLMGDFDESTLSRAYKTGLILTVIIFAYLLYKKEKMGGVKEQSPTPY